MTAKSVRPRDFVPFDEGRVIIHYLREKHPLLL